MISLKGKVVLITGGSRGIGAACVRLFAEAGARVGFTYRERHDAASVLAAEITKTHDAPFVYKMDSADPQEAPGFINAAVTFFGGVDIFVGSAGFWPPESTPLQDIPLEQWRSTMATNIDGLFYAARAAIPQLSDGGRLIFVSSTAGQRGEAGHADYASAKGAVISLVKSLAVELAPRNITVNAVAPGWVATDAVTQPFANGGLSRIEAEIPLRRVAQPRDIAGPVLFLASPLARHITGEILNVNGGSVRCG